MDNGNASETEWLTYREAAERLGISPNAVKARAWRLGWPRRPGNTPMAATRIQIARDGIGSPRDAILSELREMLAELEGAPPKHPQPAVGARVEPQEDLSTMRDAKGAELTEVRRQLVNLRQQLEGAERSHKES
jgi:hypothetical protein